MQSHSSQVRSPGEPEIAVLIPFDDPRGDPRFVKSWTRKQTCAPERFEVIVITSGASPALDEQLRLHLRPRDRLIHTSAIGRFGYYDPGAKVATAPRLLLTEDHCVADIDCIEKTLEFFAAHPHLTGGFLDAGHINGTAFARMEQRIYEQMFAQYWSREDYWDKLRIRGSVVGRAAYFAAGGLVGDYDHFAETLLSARLHIGDFKMGYVPGAIVRHVNTTHFRMMFREVIAFARGECCYRTNATNENLDYYFGTPPVWSERHLREPRMARRAAGALASLAKMSQQRGEKRAAKSLRQLQREFWLDATCGTKWREALSHSAILAAKLRFNLWRFHEPRRVEAVRDFWCSTNHLGRLRVCAQLDDAPRAITATLGEEIRIGEVPACDLVGFHAAEKWQGVAFRWSSCVALVSLRIAAGDYQLCLDTASLRGPQCDFPFTLVWNDTQLPATALQIAEGKIFCHLPAAACRSDGLQQLMIVCAPPAPSTEGPVDPRRLGMPLRAIELAALPARKHTTSGEKLAGPHWSPNHASAREYAHR